MSSKKVETRENVIKKLYDKKFGNLAQDIQEIIKEIIQKQEEEAKLILEMSKYTNNTNNLFLIKKNIISKKTDRKNVSKYNNIIGGRHNKTNNTDIKELCKANQIKLSRVVNEKRVIYTKKELITKLKRKKLI
jgi:hypothetical protein